jgi:hypothetical protein
MLRGTPDTEHTVHVTDDLSEPVPLSVLELDLDPPNVGGWAAYMAGAASGSFSMTSAVCRSPAGFSARSASLGRGSGKQRNGKRPHGDRSDWSRAGITAGSGCASPATHVGYQPIGAGMMILAGGGNDVPLDYPELELWTRVGFDRGMRSRKGER